MPKDNSIFETKKIILRPCDINDLGVFIEIFSNPDQMKYFHNCNPMTEEEIKSHLDSFIKHYQSYGWGPGVIILKENFKSIGCGGITYYNWIPESREGYLYYILKKQYWNKGLASEFTIGAINFMFHELKIKRVFSTVIPENKASIRVLEKSGMKFKQYIESFNRNLYCIENNSN